jgi:molybdopterin synthase sulfur carrier subunit
MTVVNLHGPLRTLAQGRAEHEVPGRTVAELLRGVETLHPALSGWILDEPGRIRRHINVFVNGERAAGDTAVSAADRVEVLPAITGG